MLAQTLASVLGLLVAVVMFATLAQRLRLPSPSLLALGGLLMAVIPGLPRFQLAPDIILFVFLPPLLFGAGWRISWSEFAENLRPIAILALGLVLFTTVGVAFTAHALDSALPLGAALVLGGIVSPTDPLAATSVARHVQLPRRIVTILEGESLANDATGIVVYRLAVGAVLGGSVGLLGSVYTFVIMAAGGLAIGLLIGFLSGHIQRLIDDPPIEFALQLLTGYAAYLPAERIGVSGVFAAATAGLVCGRFSARASRARSRLQAIAVWDTIDVLVNAILFLLLGLQLPIVLAGVRDLNVSRLALTGIGVSLLAVLLRMGWMFAGSLVSRLRASEPHGELRQWNTIALLGWSGMRGVLSLAAALAVPVTLSSGAPFPGRAHILFYAFCVIIVTLVVQGLPLPAVIRWLRIPRDVPRTEEARFARLRMARAARDRLDRLIADGDELTRELGADLRTTNQRLLDHLESTDGGRVSAELARLQRELAQAKRETLLDLYARRLIDDDTFRQLQRELDLEEEST